MSAPELYTPTCYQTNPNGKVPFQVFPSPTFNHDSHTLWASRHVRLMDILHGDMPPTHFVTIKFNRPESIENLKGFTSKLADAVWYFNKATSQHIAGRWVIEPEIDNSCHLHILIRATLDPGMPEYFDGPFDPSEWLRAKTDKINAKIGTVATVQYCDDLQTPAGATKYIYKLGRKDILLFARDLPMRQTGQFGKYFLGRSQADMRRNNHADRILTQMEIAVEEICCIMDHLYSQKTIPTPCTT